MSNKKIKVTMLLLSLFIVFISFTPVFAGEILKEGQELDVELNKNNENAKPSNKQNSMFEEVDDGRDPGLPDVSVDDASAWVEKKGFEVIGFLQKFIQPFAIIIFIGSAIMALAGAFGNGRLVSRGLVGMFIALIIYVVVLYAPEIMDAFLNWTRS